MTISSCAENEISLETVRHLRRWLAFARAHDLLPTTAATFPQEDTPTAVLCLRIDRLEGVVVPRVVHERFGSACRLQLCVRVSLFHEGTLRFFGRTVTTPPVPIETTGGDVTLSAPIYFRTRVCDATALAVAEPVVLVMDDVDGVVKERVAIGWATMNVFSRTAASMPTIASKPSKSSSFTRPLFQGTARALLAVEPGSDWKSLMKPSGTTRLTYDLLDASALSEALSTLIRENELITTDSIIAGLPQRGVALALTPPPRSVLEVGEPRVAVPRDVEARLVRKLDDLLGRQGGDIVQRRLHIGVHNGRCFVGAPVVLPLERTDDHDAFHLVFDGTVTIKVDAQLDDPLVVLVIEMQVDVEWVLDKATDGPRSAAPERATLCLGWTARPLYCPEMPCDSTRIAMTLLSSPGRSPLLAMTVDVDEDSPICVDVRVTDPGRVHERLPTIRTVTDRTASRLLMPLVGRDQRFQDVDDDDDGNPRKSMAPPQPRQASMSPARQPPRHDPTPLQVAASAPTAVTIEGPMASYNVDLALERTDPQRAARFQVCIEWFEGVGVVPVRAIVVAFHVFGDQSFRSGVLTLDSDGDTVLKRQPFRAALNLTHSIAIDPDDHDRFVMHLADRTTVIEVWDADAHLLIGSARLPLRSTLRQRQPSIELRATLPVENENDDDDGNKVRGRIGVTVRHFGISSDPDPTYLQSHIVSAHPARGGALPDPADCTGVVVLTASINAARSVRPRRLVEKHAVLADRLAGFGWEPRHPPHTKIADALADHHARRVDQRDKLRHLKPIVRPGALSASALAKKEQGLAVLDGFREQVKLDGVRRLMHHQTRQVRSRLGEPVVFRAQFTNPYQQTCAFRLRIANDATEGDNGGLRVVRDPGAVRYCRRAFLADADVVARPSAVDFDQISRDANDASRDAVFELSPAESTIIWFCWQSFHSGCRPTPTPDRHNEAPAPDEDDNARPRMAKRSGPVAADVSIETHTTHNHITSLKLLAAAVPFTVDETFRFHHFNNEILKGTLSLARASKLSSDHLLGRTVTSETKFPDRAPPAIAKVRCTNDRVAFEFVSEEGGPGRLAFRYPCGEFPDVAEFYLLLYEDEYCLHLRCIWRVLIYSRARVDVNATVGSSQVAQACLPPLKFMNSPYSVIGYSSNASLLCLANGAKPFELVANAFNQIGLVVRPGTSHADGERVVVNLIDTNTNAVLYGWLVDVHVTFPSVSATFDVSLPIGKSVKKKIRYRNGYNEPRTFKFESSNPTRLHVLTETVRIAAHEEGVFLLQFPATNTTRHDTVYVFINDANDQNEECLAFNLSAGSTAPAAPDSVH
ncbi:unnamed protein product (mitochondrion) [Plasmodiophora brassicae]|uniref:Nephrocystin-4 n=1 Tax=Plasmodiophora brassicae TaxID=37360 RepID=A0A3P3Y8K0_PLABS|nr:unnamed protein product [Plasmodiophora brassicae]